MKTIETLNAEQIKDKIGSAAHPKNMMDRHFILVRQSDIVTQGAMIGQPMRLTEQRFLRIISGKAFYETIFWASMLLNNGLAIMPKRNLVNNMGVTADSTHFTASLDTIPRRLRRMFTMQRFDLDFPLRHPKYVIENVAYKESVYRTNAWGHPWIKVGRSFEELYRNLRHGNFRLILQAVRRRLDKWLGRNRHR